MCPHQPQYPLQRQNGDDLREGWEDRRRARNGTTYAGTLNGTIGNDVIVGTEGKDMVDAKAGNDTICGLGGDDKLTADAGNDYVDGGSGNDTLKGSSGDDTLIGGDNDDALDGDDGNDTLIGGEGNDFLDGDKNNDTLTGNSGKDTFKGGDGTDTATDVNPAEGDPPAAFPKIYQLGEPIHAPGFGWGVVVSRNRKTRSGFRLSEAHASAPLRHALYYGS